MRCRMCMDDVSPRRARGNQAAEHRAPHRPVPGPKRQRKEVVAKSSAAVLFLPQDPVTATGVSVRPGATQNGARHDAGVALDEPLHDSYTRLVTTAMVA